MKNSVKFLLVFFGFFLLVLLGFYFYWNSLLSPVSRGGETVFIIEKGESSSSIAKRLEDKGLIRNAFAFQVMLRLSGVGRQIQAGRFQLNSSMSSKEIAIALTHGFLDQKVTLLEGWRVEEMAEYLEATTGGRIKANEFLTYAREGYMFPDTYLVAASTTAQEMAERMIGTFDQKVDDTFKKQLKAQGLTVEEAVILASLVEREAASKDDRPIVAGILLQRLRAGHPLEVDATVQYIIGKRPNSKQWWTKEITADDLQIDSPYNTRKYAGLPPGPISNPGLDVLRAVINPKKTNYWYYLTDKRGVMHYAVTLDEHNENVAKYLR